MQIQEKHLFSKPINPKSIPPLPAKHVSKERYDCAKLQKDESLLSPYSRIHKDQTPPKAPKLMKTSEDVSFEEENEDDLFKLSQFLTKRNSQTAENSAVPKTMTRSELKAVGQETCDRTFDKEIDDLI